VRATGHRAATVAAAGGGRKKWGASPSRRLATGFRTQRVACTGFCLAVAGWSRWSCARARVPCACLLVSACLPLPRYLALAVRAGIAGLARLARWRVWHWWRGRSVLRLPSPNQPVARPSTFRRLCYSARFVSIAFGVKRFPLVQRRVCACVWCVCVCVCGVCVCVCVCALAQCVCVYAYVRTYVRVCALQCVIPHDSPVRRGADSRTATNALLFLRLARLFWAVLRAQCPSLPRACALRSVCETIKRRKHLVLFRLVSSRLITYQQAESENIWAKRIAKSRHRLVIVAAMPWACFSRIQVNSKTLDSQVHCFRIEFLAERHQCVGWTEREAGGRRSKEATDVDTYGDERDGRGGVGGRGRG